VLIFHSTNKKSHPLPMSIFLTINIDTIFLHSAILSGNALFWNFLGYAMQWLTNIISPSTEALLLNKSLNISSRPVLSFYFCSACVHIFLLNTQHSEYLSSIYLF